MKYSNLTLTAAAVTAALAVGTTAQAQDADTVTTENVKVTASRVEQELMDVNMSVSVITAEDRTNRRRPFKRRPGRTHQQ